MAFSSRHRNVFRQQPATNNKRRTRGEDKGSRGRGAPLICQLSVKAGLTCARATPNVKIRGSIGGRGKPARVGRCASSVLRVAMIVFDGEQRIVVRGRSREQSAKRTEADDSYNPHGGHRATARCGAARNHCSPVSVIFGCVKGFAVSFRF